MDAGKRQQDSIALLERMTMYPQAVLGVLDPKERTRIMAEMRVLASRADKAHNDFDEMLRVADTAYRLAQATPALADLLLPIGRRVTRKIDTRIHQASYSDDWYREERAAQIRNHVIDAHESLKQALQEFTCTKEE